MTASAWNLIKLDATKILHSLTESDIVKRNGNDEVVFKYDLSSKNPISRYIISSEDLAVDNALFFQLRKILTVDSKLEVDENFMRSSIIFVDFGDVFKKDWSSVKLPVETPKKKVLLEDEALPFRMQLLFRDGLYLSFDGKNFKQFVPFDKSNSISKKCQITFIDSRIKKIFDERLMLDMDFIGKDIELSKFYAYRGLYLSSAYRIKPAPTFSLNEETVVVLEDCVESSKEFTTFSAFEQDKRWKYETKEKKLKRNLFDGEGLISPDFAEYISDFLHTEYNFPKPSHSFQIRMPFTKGVLHEVDFNKFFSDQLQPIEASELLIKDFFGVTRDLRKAKIILTKSMFKCANWMKKSESFISDPMKFFFEKFAEYDHALYVVGTEAHLSNPGHVRLNYQFLSTLALSIEDFDSLIADQRRIIDSFTKEFEKNISEISALDRYEEYNEELDEEELGEDSSLCYSFDKTTCLKAAAKNPAFFRDTKVKNISKDMKKNYECNLGLGRLEVEGEQRFLSCDLLALLVKILKKVDKVKLDDNLIKSLKNACLYEDRFFMPNNKLSIKPDKYYVFLRSPHLSRNEQVLLRAYVKRHSLHEEYFSHLKGVVMVSAKSVAAMALGGADFDGDLVKIIPDKRIVDAVKRGNQDLKLPPIEIPSTKPKIQKLGYNIPLRVIIDTFANKVGIISDWAASLADKEYSSEIVEEEYKNACAKCTIVVGLEIDAAKSGNHPEENIKEIGVLVKELTKSCGENTFLKSKEVIREIRKGHYSLRVEIKNDILNLYLSKKDKTPCLKVPIENENTSILKRLTANYLRLIHDIAFAFDEKTADKSSKEQCFNFEVSGWHKSLDKSLREELVKLIEAYRHILSLAGGVQRNENRIRGKNFAGCVINILKLQYDDYPKLSCGTDIEADLNQIYSELHKLLDTNAKIEKAIQSLTNRKWHFTCEKDRPIVAAEILGLNPSNGEKLPPSFELFYNFRCNGFGLFYFVLKDLKGLHFNKTEEATELSTKKGYSAGDNPYYNELYKIYSKNITEKKSKKIWNAQLIKICRQYLREIFDGDMYEALKYYWSQRSNDSDRKFLWEVFNEQEILPHILTPQTQN